jgi:hypothetical protein
MRAIARDSISLLSNVICRVYRVEHSEQEKDKKKKTYLKCGRIGPVENVVKVRRVGCPMSEDGDIGE